MKYYLAKYALSNGIKAFEAPPANAEGYVCRKEGLWSGFYKLGRDCFETEAEACERAEQLRVKKISSLETQIKKLKKLSFGGEQ